MKLRNKLIIILTVITALSLFVAGCAKGEHLQTPVIQEIDEDNRLTWLAIEGARSYTVSVTNAATGNSEEFSTRNVYYSLDNLDEGDYDVKVKAVGNQRETLDSEWSKSLEFGKEYTAGLVYTRIDDNTAYAVTSVGRATGSFTIRDEYKGKPVTRIGSGAFKSNAKVENVIIGNNVTVIEKEAFYSCSSLLTVTLPESLIYIGQSAFQSCTMLQSVTIPSGISDIYSFTFAYCRSLENVTFNEGLQTIGISAFYECTSVKSLEFPQSLIGVDRSAFSKMTSLQSVKINKSLDFINQTVFYGDTALTELTFEEGSLITYIGSSAFEGCSSLQNVTLPENLEQIDDRSFALCSSLNDITIPESVTQIGSYAFVGTKRYQEQLDAGEPFIYQDKWLVAVSDASKLNANITADQFQKETVGIADAVFNNASTIELIRFPKSLKYIGNYAFCECSNLQSINFEYGSELKKTGKFSFAKCKKLIAVALPDSLESIGSYTFYFCTSLGADGNTLVPESVTKIGTYVFENTLLWRESGGKDTATKKRDGIVYVGDWIVGYNNGSAEYDDDNTSIERTITDVTIPENIKGIADFAFYNLNTLITVTNSHIPQYIGAGAFYNCSSILKIILSNALTEISSSTFLGCKSLVEIGFNSTVRNSKLETIGSAAFSGCTSLRQIDLSQTRVKTIGSQAFANCVSLTKTNLNAVEDFQSGDDSDCTLTTIGSYAFYDCTALTEVSIPDSVTALGDRAFAFDKKLATVTFGNGLTYIGTSAFYGCEMLKVVELPASLEYLGTKAFYKNNYTYDVTFNNGSEQSQENLSELKYIGNYAFYDAKYLTIARIPASVTAIGKYAYKGAINISSVTIHENVESVGAHAFYGNDLLTIYVEHDGYISTWSEKWNSYYRPVVWGCELSDDKTYVKSLTVTQNTFENTNSLTELSAPIREGYLFKGWALQENGEVVYSANEILQAPQGSTLYAVWEYASEWDIKFKDDGTVEYIIVGEGTIPDFVKNKLEELGSSLYEKAFGWSTISDSSYFTVQSDFIKSLEYVCKGTKLYCYDLNDYPSDSSGEDYGDSGEIDLDDFFDSIKDIFGE